MAKKKGFLKPTDEKDRKKTLDSLKEKGIEITGDQIFGGWKEVGKLRDADDNLLRSSAT
jgi:hypothetical protein